MTGNIFLSGIAIYIFFNSRSVKIKNLLIITKDILCVKISGLYWFIGKKIRKIFSTEYSIVFNGLVFE